MACTRHDQQLQCITPYLYASLRSEIWHHGKVPLSALVQPWEAHCQLHRTALQSVMQECHGPRPNTLYRRSGGAAGGACAACRCPPTGVGLATCCSVRPQQQHLSGHCTYTAPCMRMCNTLVSSAVTLPLTASCIPVHTHAPTPRSHSSVFPRCHVTGLLGASRSASATRSLQLCSGQSHALPPCLDRHLPAWPPERPLATARQLPGPGVVRRGC